MGFYQIMKVANTPAVIVLEFFMFGRRQEPRIILSVVVICGGVGVDVAAGP